MSLIPLLSGLTLLVTFVGAAGMFAFEQDAGGIDTYGEALWWTAMLMTTLGSEHWPQTGEGRVLCFFLALYAFAVMVLAPSILVFLMAQKEFIRGLTSGATKG